MDSATEQAWIRYLQEHGLATWEQIEVALRKKQEEPNGTLDGALVRHNIITPAQRETIQKKIAEQQQGLTQLGTFRLSRKLGEGGMGAVYLAEDSMAGRTVAIKVLPPKYSTNPEFIARFRREARSTGKLSHPNIVTAYSFGEDGGHHYFVMEYMAGMPLDSRLKNGGRVPWDEAVAIIKQVASGLEYAHNHGLIHRDIKPGNIFIADTGEAKILDLGLSKNIDDSEQSFMTQSGAVLGTPHYISPEQARGDKGIDGRTDIYSLGATFYHLVTGKTPFEGSGAAVILMKHLTEQLPNPLDLNPDLPEAVVQVICKMLAKDPGDRYANCVELISDLELISQGKTPSAAHLEVDKSSVMMRRMNPNHAIYSAERRTQNTPNRKTVRLREENLPARRPIWFFAAVAATALVLCAVLIGAMRSRGKDRQASVEKPTAEAAAKGQTSEKGTPVPAAVPTGPSPQPVPAAPLLGVRPSAPQDAWANAIDLIALSNDDVDSVAGVWQINQKRLTSPRSNISEKMKFEFPYEPPREYDLRVDLEVQPGERDSDLTLVLTRDGSAFGFKFYCLNGYTLTGFENVGGQDILSNSTAKRLPAIQFGRRYQLLVEVRQAGARAYVDSERVCEWRPELGNLSVWPGWRLRGSNTVGLGTASNSVVFHSALLREVGGRGRLLRQAPPAERRVDLLALIDVERDAVRGRWERRDGGILSDATGDFAVGTGGARIEIPYRPPAEYDMRVEFTRLSGQQCVTALFPSPAGSEGARGTYAFIVGGWNNSTAGFEMVNGMSTQVQTGPDGRRNETIREGAWIRPGQRQTLLLQVRRQQTRAALDGVELSVSPQNYRNMSPAHWYALRDPALLGLSSWQSPTLFHRAEVTEISGVGAPTRGAR